MVAADVMERAPRADKGTVRLTPRDVHAFAWLADMKAIFEPDLAILLGRFSGQVPAPETVRKAVSRWQRGGYAKGQKLMVDEPRMVMLTGAGAGLVGEPDYRPQAAWTALHNCEVSRVRLWMETPGGEWSGAHAVREWQSERAFRAEMWRRFPDGTKGVHVPDAVIAFADGTEAALEVERTDKTSRRLTEILERLSTYPVVIYASRNPRIRAHVRAVRDEAKQRPGVVQVKDYPAELAAGIGEETESED